MFSGYTEMEKLEIAKRYLLPRQLEASGLKAEQLEVGDDAYAFSQFEPELKSMNTTVSLMTLPLKSFQSPLFPFTAVVVIPPGGSWEVRATLGQSACSVKR